MALILTAQPSSVLCDRATRLLNELGHRVVSVPTVWHAIAWLRAASALPDLAIVDVGMKSFRGMEFIRYIRSRQELRDLRILVQTKTGNLDFFSLCEGMLLKPYSPRELASQVSLLLSCNKVRVAAA